VSSAALGCVLAVLF